MCPHVPGGLLLKAIVPVLQVLPYSGDYQVRLLTLKLPQAHYSVFIITTVAVSNIPVFYSVFQGGHTTCYILLIKNWSLFAKVMYLKIFT